jgi:antirestriction protein ArdC
MPTLGQFSSSVAYYATSAHEHAHWTGHASRLARDLSCRFGSDAYAAEELVAELSAAFTCAHLGISTTPRPDHASYLASWLRVLRADPSALFAVASKAQAATDWLVGHASAPALGVAA